jgi:hypothetical protein
LPKKIVKDVKTFIRTEKSIYQRERDWMVFYWAIDGKIHHIAPSPSEIEIDDMMMYDDEPI